ncbi:ADP-ribosylation factor GTPase-activating protein, putative [Theileria annulata]|uniref:ADP-ribosylation factor GTPase-activating protein, putative n=1 Tax=Theileria annulata TaxID=5874 RepID=Q4UI01_THEAN|nr:ADP-ribosylation factor GTPase-activating protein, putative [Theileria annulata]CAI73288.1 ADP-ribosylation factor GTPase-activating protein, putative [Theileria annulata]|eukprot:XP_953965.1 ADP-ribosylation factor GTPase-activating protein, putative [Theileria annulata]
MAEGKEIIHLHELLAIESNNVCFDCGSVGPTWASLSHGSFICLTCSGIHRGFGLQISFVKSITMDSWTSRQLLYMKNGGNANLKAFFDEYKIMDLPITSRYKTEGAAYYRRRLRAIVDGTPVPPVLDPVIALQPESQMSDYYTNTSTESESNTSESKKHYSKKKLPYSSNLIHSDVFNSLGTTLGSFVQTACANAERAVSDIQSSQVFDNAKGVFETGKVWFKDKSKKLASQVQDPEWWEDKEAKAKVGAQKFANQLSHAASNASEWFQRIVTGIPPSPNSPHAAFDDHNYGASSGPHNNPVGVSGGASLWNSQPRDFDESDPLMSHFKKPSLK